MASRLEMGQQNQDIVANIIKVTEKTSGRDKLCRVVQYGSKFVYWTMQQASLSPDLIKKLQSLESSISTARKCKPVPVNIQIVMLLLFF